jgi:hypothetical protein
VVPPDLFGNVGEDMLHEGGELGGMLDTEESMQMIAHDGERIDSNAVKMLGASYDPEYQVVRRRTRP